MEDEKELLEQPDSSEEKIVNDDDFFSEVDNEVIEEQSKETSDDDSNETEEENQTDTDSEEEKEIDYTPFLEAISKKAKYNKEPVEVKNFDEVISNFQKGLNYDKMVEKYNNLEHSKVFSYVSKKADELGMDVDEYMNQVEQYEKEQEKAKEQKRIDEMIANGVPEDVAKEVVATSQLRKQLQEEKNQLEKEKKEREENDKKNREYADFLEAFPDVKAEDIPKEVFLDAQKSNLTAAYLKWQNAEQRKQIERLKQNEKNRSSSVGSTTQFGSKDETGETDLFLEGFNSV